MTTRQLLSIVVSSLLFRSLLTPGQWASALVVLGALYAKGGGKGGGKRGKAV